MIEQVLNGDLERFTDRTPSADELRHSVPAVRRVGWALSRGELDAGSVSVAVPVLFGGEAVCSLNVAGPESRCGSREWVKNTVQVLQSAAADLADALGAWAPANHLRAAPLANQTTAPIVDAPKKEIAS